MHRLALCMLVASAAAAATLPDFIKVCPRDVPDINRCINNSVEYIRPKLVEGIPELDVPSIVPMAIDEIKLSRGPKGALFEATLRNLLAYGAADFQITDLRADIEKNRFDFQILLPFIRFTGDYQLRMNILLLHIHGKGSITGNFTNYVCDVRMQGRKIRHGDNTHLMFDRMKFKLEVGQAELYLGNLFNGDKTLGEATNRLINQNSEYLVQEILPILEASLEKLFTDIANRITLKFKYEDLFP